MLGGWDKESSPSGRLWAVAKHAAWDAKGPIVNLTLPRVPRGLLPPLLHQVAHSSVGRVSPGGRQVWSDAALRILWCFVGQPARVILLQPYLPSPSGWKCFLKLELSVKHMTTGFQGFFRLFNNNINNYMLEKNARKRRKKCMHWVRVKVWLSYEKPSLIHWCCCSYISSTVTLPLYLYL